MVEGMKELISILILLPAFLLHGAPIQLPDNEMQTSSGITVVFRGGTMQLAVRSEIQIREILLSENFAEQRENPVFRAELAGEILAGRFGLRGKIKPLPVWISYGLEGVRKNAQSAGRIVRNQHYYPVLRGLLGVNCMPDFRALMQLDNCRFTGSAEQAFYEFGRFLLETFARTSSLKQNALGDYVAEMLKGERREPAIYRTTLLPVMTSGRYAGITELDFFKLHAERAAFNYRTPRPAEDLLRHLPEILQFEIPSRQNGKKILKGNITDLPELLAAKSPDAIPAQMQIRQKIQRFCSEFSPEILAAGSLLLNAVTSMTGNSPEEEIAAVQKGRQQLEKQLQDWSKIEKYLDDCEKQYIRPGVLFRAELSTVSEENEFLTESEKAFFNQVEQKYLEH